MKKYYPLALLMPLAICANAAQLTPEQALNRVNTSGMPAKVAPKSAARAVGQPVMAVKAPSDASFTSLYVFNSSADGYIVVSADDVAQPLLGYSDSGRFDADNVPPQLQYWLDFYAAEIQYAASHPGEKSVKAAAAADFAPIEPMLTTKWNQSAPYNDDCPMDGSSRSVTGCVATAMAQAMKYHNWPEKGTGSHSYTNNGTTISLDFSNITFDWANMTNTYGSSSTAAENAAVAQLMYACGVSVDMDYTSSESGASSMNIAPALYTYFGYSGSMTQPQRAFYGQQEWNELVYDQLAAGMPVLYGGQSNEGGHQFVCDGYSADGYFHFNWGWAGESDGYYLLSALDPMTQGIGGSTTGFNYDQGIVANMQPANAATVAATPLIYCYGDFEASSSSARVGSSATFASSYAFFNFGCKAVTGRFGIKITAADGTVTYGQGSQETMDAGSGYSRFTATIPASIADGTYTVTPAFSDGAWTDVRSPLAGIGSLTMTVANGTATFASNQTARPQVSDFALASDIYLGSNFKASFTLANSGSTEYYGQLMMGLMSTQGQLVAETAAAMAVDVTPGSSESYTFIGTFPEEMETSSGTTQTVSPGQYVLMIFDSLTESVVYEYPQLVTVNDAPSNTQLEVSGFALAGASGASNIVFDTSAIKFTGTVECVEGYYGNQLKVAIFPQGATTTSIEGSTDFLFLDEGSSAQFTATVSLSNAAEGSEYFAVAFDADNNQLTNPLYFTIGSSEAGIVNVDAADTAPARYFNLQGVEVSADSLTPGIYIMQTATATVKIRI